MKIIKYVKPKEDYSELIKRCGYEPNTPNTFLVDILLENNKECIMVRVSDVSLSTKCKACGKEIVSLRSKIEFDDSDVLQLYHELEEHYRTCPLTANGLDLLYEYAFRTARVSNNDLAIVLLYFAEVIRQKGAQLSEDISLVAKIIKELKDNL
ncbi:MAG: hypothetical protein N2255_02600 [Kiritimatiellae bacterium]|nr:hypothetical protein [Kiritimatiellia bacterium]